MVDFPASHITRGCLISCFSSPCMVGALHALRPHLYGYGSIPIHTIFRGMNIHKSQLFWCELQGYKVLTHPHIPICFSGSSAINIKISEFDSSGNATSPRWGGGTWGRKWVFFRISEAKDSIHWNTTNHGWSLIHTYNIYIYNLYNIYIYT